MKRHSKNFSSHEETRKRIEKSEFNPTSNNHEHTESTTYIQDWTDEYSPTAIKQSSVMIS